MEIKKSCNNCDDFIICLQTKGKEPKEVCEHWSLDFMTFQDEIEKVMKKTKDMNQTERKAKELLK